MNLKDLFKLSAIPVLAASLCCLSPLILVLFGLASVSFASSLANTLYGTYKWAFRAVGFLLLVIALVIYFRRKKICTLDEAKKQRRTIINTVLLTVFLAVITYIFWLYVIVHYLGGWLSIWKY